MQVKMMKVFKNVDELVGNTPLLDVTKLFGDDFPIKVFAKLECFNPAGSVKDRAALYMLNEAEKSGKIKAGATIIEPTSGNTGIGLSSLAISRGYKVILTMPDTMSIERRKILSAYGASVVLTDGKLGMQGAIERAKEINNTIENSFIPSQFTNESNAKAHYETTGPEIWADTDGNFDLFLAGVGSGGTISGVAKFLKERNSNIKVIAVEPEASPMLKEGKFGAHKIQGIGANFVPSIYDATLVDEVVGVSDSSAYELAKRFAKTFGILVGISSGAVLSAVEKISKLKENNKKTAVVILPDSGERYLSSDLYE